MSSESNRTRPSTTEETTAGEPAAPETSGTRSAGDGATSLGAATGPGGTSGPPASEVWWDTMNHRGELVALHVDRMPDDQWGLMLYKNGSFWQYRRVDSKERTLAQSAVWLRQCRGTDPDVVA